MKHPCAHRVAVIGIGGFGAFHIRAIQALTGERGVALVAAADPNLDQLWQARAELEMSGTVCYRDYVEMLGQEKDLHAVVITAPIPYHDEMVRACLRRKVYVYLEKPPVPLIQDLEALIELDRDHRVSVGFQQITSPWIQKLKSWIVGGKLGEVESIRVGASWPRLDSYYNRAPWAGKMMLGDKAVFDGPATNALSHLIHNVMYLSSSEREDFAVPLEVQGELYRARPIESYDVSCLKGRFASGLEFSAALVHASERSLPFTIEVRGSRGWARVAQDGKRLESSGETLEYGEEGDAQLKASYQCFLDLIEGKRSRAVTRLSDTRGYVLATNGALLSSKKIHEIGREWVRRYVAENDRGYDVENLPRAIRQSLKTGSLFSDSKVPWAVSTSPVSLSRLKGISLDGETEREGIDHDKTLGVASRAEGTLA